LILMVAAVFLKWRGIFRVDRVRDDHSAKALVAHDGERREHSKRRGSTLDDRSSVVIDAIKERKINGEDIPESLLASARKLIYEKSVSRPHRFMLADLALDEYWATKEIEAIFKAEICGQSFATVRDLFALVPNYARGNVSDAISQNSEISMEDVPDVLDWLSNLGPEERGNAITAQSLLEGSTDAATGTCFGSTQREAKLYFIVAFAASMTSISVTVGFSLEWSILSSRFSIFSSQRLY